MEPVRWGILGCAWIALERELPAMRDTTECALTAIASRDISKARESASRLGIPRAHGSYEALLADPEVEAVYIPLPNHMHVEWCERALRAGAMGYLMKQEASEKIIAAIQRLLQGEIYLSDKIKEKMLHRFVNKKGDGMVFSIDTLSDREMEVFQLIGNGFATRQIAQKLNLSVKTIDSYREHLKLKLRLERGADLVRHAIQWMRTESMAAS